MSCQRKEAIGIEPWLDLSSDLLVPPAAKHTPQAADLEAKQFTGHGLTASGT